MTSQQWLTPQDVSRSIWWHTVAIVIPDVILRKTKAFMYITGGSNNDGPPTADSEDVKLCGSIAVTTGAVCTVLFQVPNEPFVFAEDPERRERSEDAIIAWTWSHFGKRPQDSEWLLRLPMTKVGGPVRRPTNGEG